MDMTGCNDFLNTCSKAEASWLTVWAGLFMVLQVYFVAILLSIRTALG